jgi:hypothetical protein
MEFLIKMQDIDEIEKASASYYSEGKLVENYNRNNN